MTRTDEPQLGRSEYPNAFLANLTPIAATSQLRDRLKRARALNEELASWFKERQVQSSLITWIDPFSAAIEETYARNLQKLSRKTVVTEHSALGEFNAIWQRILETTIELGASHSTFASKLAEEIEFTLLAFEAHDEDWHGMRHVESNIASLAKYVELAEGKVEKVKKKGKALPTKVEQVLESMSIVRGQWETEAPFVFERFQAIDERRLEFIKDIYHKYENLEIEQAKRKTEISDGVLLDIGNLSVKSEIDNYVQRSLLLGDPTAAAKPRLGSNSSFVASHYGASDNSSVHNRGILLFGQQNNGTIFKASRRDSRGPRPSTPLRDLYLQSSSTPQPRKSFDQLPEIPISHSHSLGQIVNSVNEQNIPTFNDHRETKNEEPANHAHVSPESLGEPAAEDGFGSINDLPSSPQFKLEIKDQQIPEPPVEETNAALTRVSSTLRLGGSSGSYSRKNRRKDRHTMLISSCTASSELSPTGSLGRLWLTRNDSFGTNDARSERSIETSTCRHGELDQPGFNASVLETVNVEIVDGDMTEWSVWGEIALSYHHQEDDKSPDDKILIVKTDKQLDRLVPNPGFLTPLENNEFSIDCSTLQKAQIGLKYQLQIPDFLAPIRIRLNWKHEATRSSVIVSYSSNQTAFYTSLVITLSFPLEEEITSCQMKPVGLYNKDKRRLVWSLGDVQLNAGYEERIVARLGKSSAGDVKGIVGVKFSTAGTMFLQVFLKDEQGNIGYRLISGKYLAH
ncbi:Cytoskeletal protein syp1 [Neolecta irregularis DAH-3]|uniref:Cytoskeletal protein syp1 n=1 Tax=Neolecta irregularis (strain DAH-3) TaxID=1198029 RepID=A0A1U7LJN5_NEOID|nr:Cytoskeletal protein syp1 [Neolecta irregularis DAH-3]|eukprot:OLL22803.1 Cytoskeletal protein syp1 [Neolecta irregularis DAH-3]